MDFESRTHGASPAMMVLGAHLGADDVEARIPAAWRVFWTNKKWLTAKCVVRTTKWERCK